jgi:hypothetical protein
MKHCKVCAVLCLLLSSAIQGLSRQPTYYRYFTDVELEHGSWGYWEYHSFFFYDTLLGPVRSNDRIGIKYRATFMDEVTSSAPGFYNVSGYLVIHTELDPVFNRKPYILPSDMPHLRERATRRFNSNDGRLLTTFKFRGEDGISVYQRRLGIFDQDSLIDTIDTGNDEIIYVDGEVDVSGTVTGRYTIFAEGPIGLTDNLLYSGADDHTGHFDERSTRSMIGLVSRGDILVRNTLANGKANGFYLDWRNWNRHSIVINGSLLALGGKFTYERGHLERTDSANFRGNVVLVGGLGQAKRERWRYHDENHQDFLFYATQGNHCYDARLRKDGPPGLGPGDYPLIQQDNRSLKLQPFDFRVLTSTATSLIMEHGGQLTMSDSARLEIDDSLILKGEPNHPLEIVSEGVATIASVGRGRIAILENVVLGDGISLDLDFDSITINGCIIRGPARLSGEIECVSTDLSKELSIFRSQAVRLERIVLRAGATVSSNSRQVELTNCTFIEGESAGLRLRGSCEAILLNSIIAFNSAGVVVEGSARLTVNYCSFFNNRRSDISGADFGEGCIFQDPLFVSSETGDLHLLPESPCIDSGDPASPSDDDGSRVDIGAFSFDHRLSTDKDGNSSTPTTLVLGSYPNPFNSSTTINYTLPTPGWTTMDVVDVSGRLVERLSGGWKAAGRYREVWDGEGVASGEYLIRLQSDKTPLARQITIIR